MNRFQQPAEWRFPNGTFGIFLAKLESLVVEAAELSLGLIALVTITKSSTCDLIYTVSRRKFPTARDTYLIMEMEIRNIEHSHSGLTNNAELPFNFLHHFFHLYTQLIDAPRRWLSSVLIYGS